MACAKNEMAPERTKDLNQWKKFGLYWTNKSNTESDADANCKSVNVSSTDIKIELPNDEEKNFKNL